jgi:hypothetical protein
MAEGENSVAMELLKLDGFKLLCINYSKGGHACAASAVSLPINIHFTSTIPFISIASFP